MNELTYAKHNKKTLKETAYQKHDPFFFKKITKLIMSELRTSALQKTLTIIRAESTEAEWDSREATVDFYWPLFQN